MFVTYTNNSSHLISIPHAVHLNIIYVHTLKYSAEVQEWIALMDARTFNNGTESY